MISPTSLLGSNYSGLNGGLTPGIGNAGTSAATGTAGTSGTAGIAGLTGANAASQLPANPNPLGDGGLGNGGVNGGIQQILSMLLSILQMLLPMLMQGAGQPAANDIGTFDPKAKIPTGGPSVPPGLSDAAPTIPPSASGPAPADAAHTARAVRNTTADPAQQQRLNNTLAKVARDPEGNQLLKAAQANGYTIEVGDPSGHGNMDKGDQDSVNGVTLPDQKKIIISPNAPDFDKTVVHELVHAATEKDGNSQTEEGMADVIGYRVSSRMNGTKEPGSEQQIFQNKLSSYPNLQANNNIINSLHQLGIRA